MPLVASILQGEILKLTDQRLGDFVGFPAVIVGGVLDVVATNDLVATNWSNAVSVYILGITNPIVSPPTIVAAVAAFKAAMFGLLGPPGSPTGAVALTAGLAALAAVIAAGSPPFVVTPPPPFVAPLLPPIPDPAPPASTLAAAIDAWARTGLASIPPAPPIPWS
jgi:hypothetical protein